MHPHANTAVFTKEQIDLYMENTNPEYVFCVLTAARHWRVLTHQS